MMMVPMMMMLLPMVVMMKTIDGTRAVLLPGILWKSSMLPPPMPRPKTRQKIHWRSSVKMIHLLMNAVCMKIKYTLGACSRCGIVKGASGWIHVCADGR